MKSKAPAFLLNKYCINPENFPDHVVAVSKSCVTIKDKFPKATHHFLVMPRIRIQSVSSLTDKHLDLLLQMKEQGESVISQLPNSFKYKMGFHSIPSVNQLHLHVISQDFVSSCLKTKKHYNSFTTKFFIELDDVMDQLQTKSIQIDTEYYSEMLKKPLTCVKCLESISNMPNLKNHLKDHLKQNLMME